MTHFVLEWPQAPCWGASSKLGQTLPSALRFSFKVS